MVNKQYSPILIIKTLNTCEAFNVHTNMLAFFILSKKWNDVLSINWLEVALWACDQNSPRVPQTNTWNTSFLTRLMFQTHADWASISLSCAMFKHKSSHRHATIQMSSFTHTLHTDDKRLLKLMARWALSGCRHKQIHTWVRRSCPQEGPPAAPIMLAIAAVPPPPGTSALIWPQVALVATEPHGM